MNALFMVLVNRSLAAGWLVLAVLLLRPLLKKAPRWVACLLWAAVAVRLLCPFSIESPWSVIPSTQPVPLPGLPSGMPMSMEAFSGLSTAAKLPPPVVKVYDGISVAAVLWAVGAAGMVLYGLISFLRLHHQVRLAMHLGENAWICDEIDTPFILGFFRPKIYLPSTLDFRQIPYVMAHEKAHLRRRDHWWKPLGFCLLAIYWFHPLIWLAYVLLCRDIELACDQRVIREMELEDKKAYSQALLACTAHRRSIAACPLAFGEVGVKERVKNVLNYKKPAFWILILAIVVCIVVAVCFLTNPVEMKAPSEVAGTYVAETMVYRYPYTSAVIPSEIAQEQSIRYAVTEAADGTISLTVTNLDTGETLGTATASPEEWKKIPPELLQVSFQDVYDGTLDFSGVRNVWNLSMEDRYQLTFLDGQLWVSEFLPKSKTILYTYSLRPAEAGVGEALSAAEAGSYAATRTLYVNPLSNFSYPDGDNGTRYTLEVPENAAVTLTVCDQETDQVMETSTISNPVWQDIDAETWNSLFFCPEANIQPDISAYSQPKMLRLDNGDFLFRMDGALWFGQYGNDKNGMWVIHALMPTAEAVYTPDTAETSLSDTENHPEAPTTPVDTSGENGDDGLELALRNAILSRDAGEKTDGLIRTESHVVLYRQDASGTPKAGSGDDHQNTVTLYALVMTRDYREENGSLIEENASHIPAAITFTTDGHGTYTLIEYWTPRDGSLYEPDIREKFPAEVAEAAMNQLAEYAPMQKAACWAKAKALLNRELSGGVYSFSGFVDWDGEGL